jgi:hypothetical protein
LRGSAEPADTRAVTSSLFSRGRLVALAVAIAVVPVTAGPADAAPKDRQKAKHAATTVAKKRAAKKRQGTKPVAPAATPAPVATPTPAETPAFTSVISIGGYVFYNLTLAEAYDAYAAAVAAAPAGYTPPPVTSVSVTSTVSGSGS